MCIKETAGLLQFSLVRTEKLIHWRQDSRINHQNKCNQIQCTGFKVNTITGECQVGRQRDTRTHTYTDAHVHTLAQRQTSQTTSFLKPKRNNQTGRERDRKKDTQKDRQTVWHRQRETETRYRDRENSIFLGKCWPHLSVSGVISPSDIESILKPPKPVDRDTDWYYMFTGSAPTHLANTRYSAREI